MSRFCLPRDIYHGKGCLEELKNLKGKKAILVVGGGSMKRQGFLDKAVNYLKEAGMEVQLFEGVEPDPSVETVMKGAEAMRAFEPDWIVAMGGGSPIDAAKAMWAFYEYPDTTFEQLCIPFNFPKLRTKAKFCAIPSTSGTATEVTAFSVITDYQKGIKYPLADFNITPDVAIIDPALAETMPPKLVAHTGMDALTHAIEAFVSVGAHPLTDANALEAIRLINLWLPKAVDDGHDLQAREQMAFGQYLAGMAFNSAGLGLVHALAHQPGATHNLPHGVCNAILLPIIENFNRPNAVARFARVAQAMGVDTRGMSDEAASMEAINAIRTLSKRVGIPQGFSQLGVSKADIEGWLDKALADPCAPCNPRPASRDEVRELYLEAL